MEFCENCKHWEGDTHFTTAGCRKSKPVIVESIVAQCLVQDPTDHSGAIFNATWHPQTYRDDWCGEWEGR